MEIILNKKVLPTKILLKEPKPEEKVTKSNIILPNVVKPSSSMGRVVLTGTKVEDIKPSDLCMYSPHAVQKVTYEDQEYVLLNWTDVLLYWADEAS